MYVIFSITTGEWPPGYLNSDLVSQNFLQIEAWKYCLELLGSVDVNAVVPTYASMLLIDVIPKYLETSLLLHAYSCLNLSL